MICTTRIDAGEAWFDGPDGLIQQMIEAGLERGLEAGSTWSSRLRERGPGGVDVRLGGLCPKTVATSVEWRRPGDPEGSAGHVHPQARARRIATADGSRRHDLLAPRRLGGVGGRRASLGRHRRHGHQPGDDPGRSPMGSWLGSVARWRASTRSSTPVALVVKAHGRRSWVGQGRPHRSRRRHGRRQARPRDPGPPRVWSSGPPCWRTSRIGASRTC
jgi:hypothetical protein